MKKINKLILLILFIFTNPLWAVTFTTNTLIDANDNTYEAQDIIVDGCTLTINGQHQFNNLEVINSGMVTHSAADSGQPDYKIDLTITNDVNIAAGGSISADGKGYGPDSGSGAGGMGGTRGGGASHGGVGGDGLNGIGSSIAYGSVIEPVDLGSGGSSASLAVGGSGGGILRLTVGSTLRVDGTLTANGEKGKTQGVGALFSGGGGSGGSIYLSVMRLDGNGVISADGGDGGTTQAGGGNEN